MNSPMVKRRSHLRSCASGSSNSLATQKRVSFYSNDSDIVENSDSSEDKAKPRSSLQRYRSEWILGGDEAFTEKSELKKTGSRHLRRFQSDMNLNKNDFLRDPFCGLERGVPEGQEDPDRFNSWKNLSIVKTAEELGRKSQISWSNANLTKYAQSLLTSMKSSVEVQKPIFNDEMKRTVFLKAQSRISSTKLDLPFPTLKVDPQTFSQFNKEVNEEIANNWDATTSDESKLCQAIVETLGLGDYEHYKLFRGYLNFCAGKPCKANIVLGRKAMYVTLGTSHSLYWSAALFDIIDVRVKSAYTELSIKSIVSEVRINFPETFIARQCASFLDLYLNTLDVTANSSCLVSVETAMELQKKWNPWIVSQTSKETESLEHLGLVFWEEVNLPNIIQDDSSILGPYRSGHLMFTWNKSRSWQPGYFVVKAGVLYQFMSAQDQVPVFMLALSEDHCKGYGRNFLSSRPHTIEIHIDKRKCLLLAAASEAEASDWLSTISLSAAVWDGNHDVMEPCNVTACGIAISCSSILLFRAGHGVPQCLTSSSTENICHVGVPKKEEDLFCIVEFACREASEGEGDWILYFSSAYELQQFISALKCPVQVLSDSVTAALRQRCQAAFT